MTDKKLIDECLLKVPSHSESVYCSCGNEEGIESRIEEAYKRQLEHAIPIIQQAVRKRVIAELNELITYDQKDNPIIRVEWNYFERIIMANP